MSAAFFSKERKRTQRAQHFFQKNAKERKEHSILFKRTQKNAKSTVLFSKE
jgi:hypothetical protein